MKATHEQPQQRDSTKDDARVRADGRAFGLLPVRWARDTRLAPAHLVILAYRVTWADDRGDAAIVAAKLAQVVNGPGLGEKPVQHKIRDLLEWGMITNRQLAAG
jgi:hypothetical protein